MANALATTNKAAGIAALLEGDNPFDKYTKEMGTTDTDFISFSGNTGKWLHRGSEIDPGSVLAFDIFNAEVGWMAWKNNKPVERIFVSIVGGDRLPSEEELTDHWDGLPPGKRARETDGWRSVVNVVAQNPDGGPRMVLTLANTPAYRPINRLIKEYGQHARMNLDDAGNPMIPLVEIDTEEFDSRGGKKYSPVLTIVGWLSEAEFDSAQSKAAVVVEEPAPTRAPVKALEPPRAIAPRPVAKRR